MEWKIFGTKQELMAILNDPKTSYEYLFELEQVLTDLNLSVSNRRKQIMEEQDGKDKSDTSAPGTL